MDSYDSYGQGIQRHHGDKVSLNGDVLLYHLDHKVWEAQESHGHHIDLGHTPDDFVAYQLPNYYGAFLYPDRVRSKQSQALERFKDPCVLELAILAGKV